MGFKNAFSFCSVFLDSDRLRIFLFGQMFHNIQSTITPLESSPYCISQIWSTGFLQSNYCPLILLFAQMFHTIQSTIPPLESSPYCISKIWSTRFHQCNHCHLVHFWVGWCLPILFSCHNFFVIIRKWAYIRGKNVKNIGNCQW